MMLAPVLEQAKVLMTTQQLILSSTAFQGWIQLLPLVLGDVIEACHLSNQQEVENLGSEVPLSFCHGLSELSFYGIQT